MHPVFTLIFTLKNDKASSPSIEIKKPLPFSIQCFIKQIELQKPTLLAVTYHKLDKTQSAE